MLTGRTPAAWRRGYTLHRRRVKTDGYGDPAAYYDMEHPDFTAEDGGPAGICWQSVRAWQSSGALRAGAEVRPYGERSGGVLQGVLYGETPEAAEFDRFVIGGVTYELRGVERWPGHRLLLLQRVK